MLYVYNSLTKKKERFIPITPGKIGLYACGVTVYDYCHLGHGRSMVCFDVIVRYLRSQEFTVTFVRNITDIDDKIIARAQEKNVSIEALTEKYIQAMQEDATALGIIAPDAEPRATQYIEKIIQFIRCLLEKNRAYISTNGDICYSIEQFKEYGKLSNKKIDELLSGARVEVVKEKRSPLDFVLWKKAKDKEPFWESPWGNGRPGWHIECSVMAINELSEHFDMHGGGLDLQFPHHENEIALSESCTEKTFANYWLHVGMLQINQEKMAKSTGNFLTIREVLKKFHPEVIRYFLLSNHYRSPLNYSEENIHQAEKSLFRLYQTLSLYPETDAAIAIDWKNQFNQVMDDDFNTPEALAILFKLCHEINRNDDPSLIATLKYLAHILGLLNESPTSFLQQLEEGMNKEEIEHLIQQRLTARLAKDWKKADSIRDQLAQAGIELEDHAQGTSWRKR